MGILASFTVNPGSATAAPSRANAVSWGASVFKTLNAERASHHLRPLAASVRLVGIAHAHNLKMAAYNRGSHQLSGELSARARIARAGFSASTAGENLAQTTAWTLAGAYAQQRAMYSEPYAINGRRANILNSAFRYVGVDVAIDAVHHKLWITEDFSILAPMATPAAATVSLATEMLKAMNAERALHGRVALRMNSLLIRSAHGHNLKMASANSMSHLVPGEYGFLARLLQVGYSPRAAAENIGWNSDRSVSGVLYLQRIMYNELPPNDAHRVNILSPTYREVGIDVYMDTAHDRLWITQDFGLHA
ncbi:MAG: CAP domain-containing protein [Pseudonocardiales bacterium]